MFVGNAASRRPHCTLCNPKEHSKNPRLCRNLFRIYYWEAEKDLSPAVAMTAFVFARSLKLIDIHTYMHACVRTYIHSFFHSFIHTYTHTHTHTHSHFGGTGWNIGRSVIYFIYLFIVFIYRNTVNTEI